MCTDNRVFYVHWMIRRRLGSAFPLLAFFFFLDSVSMSSCEIVHQGVFIERYGVIYKLGAMSIYSSNIRVLC